jgi:phosphate binding protein
MSLTGDVNTLALADLVQVNAMNYRTCQIRVMSPQHEGDLFLERGAVVHAWWGDLIGAEAVYAMLNTSDVGFHVRGDVTIEAHTIAADWQQLVLEAARRQDHGIVPKPTTRTSSRWKREPQTEPSVPSPKLRSDTYSEPQPRLRLLDSYSQPQPLALAEALRVPKGPPAALWLIAGGLVMLALVLLGWRIGHGRDGAAARASAARVNAPLDPSAIVDAAQLTGPNDAMPTLLEGTPPAPPHSEWAVTPTIVCRLTLDRDGNVRQSRVYRSRLDLAAFEDAALAAVEKYRFTPGRRSGVPVAVTINWPISFASPGHTTRIVKIKGSDTIGGALAPALGRVFHEQHPDIEISVEALGSKTAFVGLFDGTAALGASSRPVNAEEMKQAARFGVTLREFVIAYDGIAVIVHPSNAVKSLTLDDVAKIFSGQATDWSAFGGEQGAINVITRPSYSGTHAFFRDKVLRHGDTKGTQDFVKSARVIEDNKELLRAVAADPRAVAFIGNGWLGPSVRALPIAGERGGAAILPSTSSIRDGSYAIYRPLLFYTSGTPTRDSAAFLSFVLSAAGQAIVRDNGFVPIDVPANATIIGAEPEGAPREPLRIQFRAASTRLDPAAIARLAALAKQARGRSLLVVGHSDAEGDAAMNHHLARARAERVAAQLLADRLPPESIAVESDDADAPVASNSSAVGRRQNRRADVFLLAK